MMHAKMSKAEKDFLESYDINAFDRPSIAADIAIFSILQEDGNRDIRKLEKKALKILLIKRGSYPYKDAWALPGGFCRPGEDVAESAKRELAEETNVENAYLQLVGVFGKKNRDPRGWIISNTFMALMDGEQCHLRAGSDAWEAQWFTVEIMQEETRRDSREDEVFIENDYVLQLTNKETGVAVHAKIKEYKRFQNYHETVQYEILDNDNLAFDHAQIILSAALQLRKAVAHDVKLAFDLMPALFTLTQLQNTFEILMQQELITANFRRKIAEYVVETNQTMEGVGYRPAKLFKRNVEAFYQ